VLHGSVASRADAEAAAASINEHGGKAGVLASDLREPGSLARLAADAAAIFGPLTLLVDNAAIFEADDAASIDLERGEKHFSVNLGAPLVLPQFFTYGLSKSALWAATRPMSCFNKTG
jgi:NAD(P)-dependent dehydrogenase (short-subunit alcohol dehydrogenase family)